MKDKDGKNNLNLTDRDMILLSEAATRIKHKREGILIVNEGKKQSYYKDYEDLKLFPEQISIYDFETARELTTMLKELWGYQHKPEMKEIVKNCVASTYKYLNEKSVEEKKPEISPFIYEF